jgi:tRNA/rRNA methyltransferase
VLSAREAAAEAAGRSAAGDVALVFGNETSGLSNEQLLCCTALAYIPTSPAYSSLNLGAAVQVACYEARMAAGGGRQRSSAFAPATHDEIENLYAHAARTLVGLSFLDPRRPRRLLPRLRRLFSRTGLEREEVHILRGILAAADAALLQARAVQPHASDREAFTGAEAAPGQDPRRDRAR